MFQRRFFIVLPPKTLVLVAALLATSLTGCSLLSGDESPQVESEDSVEPEGPAKELGADEKVTSVAPEGELFRTAQKLFHAKMFTLAKQSFQTLHDQYPTGAYAAYSEIKLADSFFFGHEFNEAAKRYEEFSRNYPASSDLPYVKLQAARSLVLASKGGGRDRGPHEKALTLLDSIIQQYPNSAYAAVADKERLKVVEELSSYDRMVIDFYERRENTAAVEARQKQFNQRWKAALSPKVSPQVLLDNVMSPLSSGSPIAQASAANTAQDGEQTVAAPVVVANDLAAASPASDIDAGLALAALKHNGATADGSEGPLSPETKEPSESSESSVSKLNVPTILLQKVQCRDNGQPFVMLELGKDSSELPLSLTRSPTQPVDGYVTLPGIKVRSIQPVFDCFSEGDLRITEDNQLQLESSSAVTVTTLANPARLLIIPE